jgi:hypothetical protein
MQHRRATLALAALLALLAVLPAGAYTIYLKDGSTIIAKEVYRLDGDKAYITLPSGTETFLDADQIDVERTREINAKDYGTAVVIEGGQRRQLEAGERAVVPRETRLSDVIGERGGATRLPDNSSQSATSPEPSAAPARGRTATGAANLATLTRAPLPDADLAQEITGMLSGQQLESLKVFRGTTARRPFLEVTASSEGAVFRAIAASARALTQLRERYEEQVEGIELLILTATRERAGQFYITPETARQLTDGELQVSEFFVQYVQF